MVYFLSVANRPSLRISGDRLRSLRLAAFLTQAELAVKAEVHVATIKAIEAAPMSTIFPTTARKLAAALGREPSEVCEVVEAEAS